MRKHDHKWDETWPTQNDPPEVIRCMICGIEKSAVSFPAQDATTREGNFMFGEFSRINRARCESPQGFNHKLDSWSVSDWLVAILGELGEAANIVKKLNRVRDGIRGNKETEQQLCDKLRQELGDTFVYLDLIGQSLGFNIGDAAMEVFKSKSKEIGYVCDPTSAATRVSRSRDIQNFLETVAWNKGATREYLAEEAIKLLRESATTGVNCEDYCDLCHAPVKGSVHLELVSGRKRCFSCSEKLQAAKFGLQPRMGRSRGNDGSKMG